MTTGAKLGAALLGAGLAYGLYRRKKQRDLRGKNVLVTGSSRGLGLLLAREYARQGCRVILTARDEAELLRARDQLRRDGAEVIAVPCDITDEEQVQALIDASTVHFGQIDILVNNAGIIQVGPVEQHDLEDYTVAMDTMFYGTLLPTLAVLPQMIERRGGRIVNITSIGGKISVPHLLPYSCAKFAAVGLSRGLRSALARHKIAVTTIVPGLMRTGSYVHAEFTGRRDREFAWFSLGSSLPLITVDAERAAREVVEASRKRKAEHVIGMPAKTAMAFNNLFPGLTANLLGLVNRTLLPSAPDGPRRTIPGHAAQEELSPLLGRVVKAGTALGREAGQKFNER